MSERESHPDPGQKCPRCGAELPRSTPPEFCPKCLLRAGLPTETRPTGTEIIPAPPVPASNRGPKPGEVLGHYRIVRLLGEGGMGAVYDAEDLDSGRRVAVKVLSHKLDSPEARERFLREGRLAASINHPNSVYVFGTEEIGGTPAISMELVAGGTLADRVREHGPLPVAEAVDSVLQIITGLEAAQRIGILHRDIKPSNCFRDNDGAVKIGDFGLSISTAVRTEPGLTAAGIFLGTPAFCSPEQLRGDELNVRSDMYSVGATLFFLLTGRTPFEAENTVQLLATVLEKRAPSPEEFRRGIPRGLARAVLRCLEKLPGNRFKNYEELSRTLAPYSSVAPTPATLGLRIAAGVLDHSVVSLVWMAGMLLGGKSPYDIINISSQGGPKSLLLIIPALLSLIGYYGILEGIWGASLGKALCQLRVVGPDRNAPGVPRAAMRGLLYVLLPMAPFWLWYGLNSKDYAYASPWLQSLVSFSYYMVIGLMFAGARRRNGFAALQDVTTNTRVVSRMALGSRPALAENDVPARATEAGRTIGPYQVIEQLEQTESAEWLLGYDLRLLRKVWIRLVPAGTPSVPAALRNLGRMGRLRWLTGRRAADENWDAFECPGGKPLLNLASTRQSWGRVRYWLYDLAAEIDLATREGTLPPVLGLDRVWITEDGRAKLLDFPAPGTGTVPVNAASAQNSGQFLSNVAAMALNGATPAAGENDFPAPIPLPLHARQFLEKLPQLPSAEAASLLKPLLQRLAEVTRARRAAIVAGCLAMPALSALAIAMSTSLLQQWDEANPGATQLFMLLQKRSAESRFGKGQSRPTDQQYEVFIATHYRTLITNEASWHAPVTMSLIKGDARKLAEQSLVDYPAPTEAESKDAEKAVGKRADDARMFGFSKQKGMLFFIGCACLIMYVSVPAIAAALLFRGGLILLVARTSFVRKDGKPASRMRLLWRSIVAWSPMLLALLIFIFAGKARISPTAAEAYSSAIFGLLAVVSIALPVRGLQDRLAGVWPVPR